jgi:hypothetical protein
MKNILAAAALSLPLLASAQNLLINGSFELGLTGWTVSNGAGTVFPVSTVAYGVLPGAFNQIVPPDDVAGNLSPDAVGTQAVYFVDDVALQSISQTFTVAAAGLFNIGGSFYVPTNGAANPGDVLVTITDPAESGSSLISSLPVATWTGGNVVATLQPGVYTYTVSFAPQGNGFGKDILFDRLYVATVPEPGTIALLLAGLGIVSVSAARRRLD